MHCVLFMLFLDVVKNLVLALHLGESIINFLMIFVCSALKLKASILYRQIEKNM